MDSGQRKTFRGNLSAGPDPSVAPPTAGIMITVRYGKDESRIFNANCSNIILLNHIKRVSNFVEIGEVDLATIEGGAPFCPLLISLLLRPPSTVATLEFPLLPFSLPLSTTISTRNITKSNASKHPPSLLSCVQAVGAHSGHCHQLCQAPQGVYPLQDLHHHGRGAPGQGDMIVESRST